MGVMDRTYAEDFLVTKQLQVFIVRVAIVPNFEITLRCDSGWSDRTVFATKGSKTYMNLLALMYTSTLRSHVY
jgi:hypothetical protein